MCIIKCKFFRKNLNISLYFAKLEMVSVLLFIPPFPTILRKVFVQPGLSEAKTRSRQFRNYIVAIMNLSTHFQYILTEVISLKR